MRSSHRLTGVINQSLRLGAPFGIETRVHWTFGLLLAWMGWAEFQRDGWQGALFGVGLLMALFACVTLHELGHSLAARRFGIGTASITLYPIGGVARLDALPRKPMHEIVIALAGPAVNVVLAVALFPVLLGLGFGSEGGGEEAGSLLEPSLSTFVLTVFVANVAMFAFNLLPAFPMDGGRVFRAVLALGGNYMAATNVAARVGQFIALLFVLAGFGVFARWVPWMDGNFVLTLIGVFIFFNAGMERRMVERMMAYRFPSDSFQPFPPPLPPVLIEVERDERMP